MRSALSRGATAVTHLERHRLSRIDPPCCVSNSTPLPPLPKLSRLPGLSTRLPTPSLLCCCMAAARRRRAEATACAAAAATTAAAAAAYDSQPRALLPPGGKEVGVQVMFVRRLVNAMAPTAGRQPGQRGQVSSCFVVWPGWGAKRSVVVLPRLAGCWRHDGAETHGLHDGCLQDSLSCRGAVCKLHVPGPLAALNLAPQLPGTRRTWLLSGEVDDWEWDAAGAGQGRVRCTMMPGNRPQSRCLPQACTSPARARLSWPPPCLKL